VEQKNPPRSEVEEAISAKEGDTWRINMGEVDGINRKVLILAIPREISGIDLRGRTLIQRTSAGTQGILRAIHADRLFAASFVVAKATAFQIQQISPEVVSFIVTGESLGRDGDEDRACGEYIQALINGEDHDPRIFTQRVVTSSVGQFFERSKNPYISRQGF
jgi:2-phosphosulfolactate phosphatase